MTSSKKITKPIALTFQESDSLKDRFEQFIRWGEPFGIAGINTIHADHYDCNAPLFSWSESFFSSADRNVRSWFLKYEYLADGRSVFKRSRQEDADTDDLIKNRNGLFSEGLYLRFCKAYINVIVHYRAPRTHLKRLVHALTYLEKSLRDLNEGDDSPINIKMQTFERAVNLILTSSYAPTIKYELGKELEMLAGMLQSGFQSKNFRFDGQGFRILKKPFSFASGIPLPARRKAIKRGLQHADSDQQRLSAAEVAAVGLAYQKAVSLYKKPHGTILMAATVGLAFTTVSLRAADLVSLRRDALYKTGRTGKYRLRIYRSKIDVHQDLPLTDKLGGLASELFNAAKKCTKEAHETFQFYIHKFGDSLESIDELYIPPRYRKVFKQEFLSLDDLRFIFNVNFLTIESASQGEQVHTFVRNPGDILTYSERRARHGEYIRIDRLEKALINLKIAVHFPADMNRKMYVGRNVASRFMGSPRNKTDIMEQIMNEYGEQSISAVCTADIHAHLLQEFKANAPLNWPYVSKERNLKVDEALLVSFFLSTSQGERDPALHTWWCPMVINTNTLSSWTNGSTNIPPRLFSALDIRLDNGQYPRFTLHDSRKLFHTEALLAGVNEVLLDELAGRQSGWQSDHYDLRTPEEIVAGSLETFDPDADYKVIGPVAEQAKKIKVTDRKTFLYNNAAPKHLTEIGGCTTDWSLNPCDQYGGCTRCDKQVWRKGDQKRLPHVITKIEHAQEMILIAGKKIEKGNPPHSLALQHRQFQDDLSRCNKILEIEADDTIPIGTLVTFSLARNAMGAAEWTSHMRKEHVQQQAE